MQAEHNQPEYTRRKFTLPPNTDDLLTSLAERHYQGNVSLFLRSAIEDHRTTIEDAGSEERVLHEIKSKIRSLDATQADLINNIDTILDRLEEVRDETTTRNPRVSANLPQTEQFILFQSLNSDQGSRFRDLVEQTSHSPEEIQSAIHTLLDLGYLTRQSDGRFLPTGTRSDTVEENT